MLCWRCSFSRHCYKNGRFVRNYRTSDVCREIYRVPIDTYTINDYQSYDKLVWRHQNGHRMSLITVSIHRMGNNNRIYIQLHDNKSIHKLFFFDKKSWNRLAVLKILEFSNVSVLAYKWLAVRASERSFIRWLKHFLGHPFRLHFCNLL